MEINDLKGKGAQFNPANKFESLQVVQEHIDGLDEPILKETPKTEIFYETPKKIISKNDSPDLKLPFSINPYQGCEHGCVYCYARNSHQYWGFSAGLDFETKIIVKPKAAEILEKQFLNRNWKSTPIMLSGNTDCYQPMERKFKITRSLLEVFLKYRNPVSLITKNALVTRDIDLLKELASLRLVHILFSITTLDEKLRSILEPRTASAKKKLNAIEKLSKAGVPVGIMNAPIIPSLNHHEIPSVLKSASDAGAVFAGYTVVRLNGEIEQIAKDWLFKKFPDRANKVWSQIKELHAGKVNDSEWGRRLSGDGSYAEIIKQLFSQAKKKYFDGKSFPDYDLNVFRKGGNYQLF